MELYWIACAGLIGLLVGSFLNVVIYRLPLSLIREWRSECEAFLSEEQNEQDAHTQEPTDANTTKSDADTFNVAYPRSHCPSCKALIPAWCNIPLFSYLLLKGRCLHCKISISLRYPFIELLTGLITAFVVFTYGLSYEALAVCVFSWVLISLTYIDIDHKLLPDNLTLPLLWLGLLCNAFGFFTDLHSAVLGAAFGYLSLWSVYWLFKLITGKEGMGYGDFKLLAALGAWLGWQYLPTIIVLSSFVGAVIGICGILLAGQSRSTQIPFGPYLAIAGWIAFFWGEHIQTYYLNILSPAA